MSEVTVGFVAIGRNEGERAMTCVKSALRDAADPSAVVYVDSGSTDGSPAKIAALGVTVVDLDTSQGFTAARARNAGLAELKQRHPGCVYAQFLDGDCELVEGWIATAIAALETDDQLAGVCGRRRERFPEASVYNKLCDMEWDTPVGPADATGGDALFRIAALDEVDAYDPTMIAGEEPEMCIRLRAKNWTLARLDAEMTLHDAAMTSWRQWWNRNKRAGHAYAETLDRHPPTGKKEVRSNWILGIGLPVGAALAFLYAFAASWFLTEVIPGTVPKFVGYLIYVAPLGLFGFFVQLQRGRIANSRIRHGDSRSDALDYGSYVLLGKLPQAMGQLKYRWNKLRGKKSGIIEYKDAEPAAASPKQAA